MSTHKRVSKLNKGDEFKRYGKPWTITSQPEALGRDNLYEFNVKNPEGARDTVFYRGSIQVEIIKEAVMSNFTEEQLKIRESIEREEYPELDARQEVDGFAVLQHVTTIFDDLSQGIDIGEEADIVGFANLYGVESALVIFEGQDPVWVSLGILEDCS